MVERVFPYGHPGHRPPELVPMPERGAFDPTAMTDDDLHRALDGLEANQRWLDAVRLGVLGEYEQRGLHERTGAVSVANDLGHRHGRYDAPLRRAGTTARKLRQLPLMTEALRSGVVTSDHAEALASALTQRTAEAMGRHEARLVRLAQRLAAPAYRDAVRFWAAHADPDGAEPDSGAANELWLSETLDGTGRLKANLDAETYALVKNALGDILDELHRDAGEPAPLAGPSPTPAEQRAAAFAELVRRGGAVDAEAQPHRRTRPQVVATIDHDNLADEVGLGELDTGTAISATAVRRLACDADIISAVFGGDSELLDLGRKARLVSPAQRAALALRDRGCTFPNCDRPPSWCDAHHIHHWIDGGPTDLDNLTLLCSRHHHLLHEGGWRVRRDRSGELVFTNRAGVILANPNRRPGHPDPWVGSSPGHPPERRSPARRAPTEDDDEDAA